MTVEPGPVASEITVATRGLGKAYRLYHRPEDRIKHLLPGQWRHGGQEFWALKDVNLELRRGETLGILGVNGAGKSTLLQLICGTLRPTTGSVAGAGRIAALLALGAGFHPQFTGRENVRLKAAALGLTRDQIKERMNSIAEFAAIGEFLDLPVRLYSSGMYARLAFAVCAHVDADILIVDEVLAVGDAAFRQKCTRFLNRFREQGTVLFVSHSSATVAEICGRALWLDHGCVREIGPAGEVSAHYLSSLSEGDGSKPQFRSDASADRWWAPPQPPLLSDFRARHSSKITVSQFNGDAPWHGVGGLVIEDVGIYSPEGARLALLAGGDQVELRIVARPERRIAQPILGFILRDRFGQNVFGDNTYVAYRHSPPSAQPGERVEGAFRFQMPILAAGDYSITVAFVEGTQEDHTHLQWMEDALVLSVSGTTVRRGIVALPTLCVGMDVLDAPSQP